MRITREDDESRCMRRWILEITDEEIRAADVPKWQREDALEQDDKTKPVSDYLYDLTLLVEGIERRLFNDD